MPGLNTKRILARMTPFVVAAVTLAFACGDDAGPAPDTAVDASIETGVEAAVDTGPIVDATPPCLPIEPPALAPVWGSIKPRVECDVALVEKIVKCVFGDPEMPTTECVAASSQPAWATCTACLFGDEGLTPGGDGEAPYETPLIVHAGIARVNVAACLALHVADANLSGCVGSWYALEQCRTAACAHCTEAGPEDYEGCRSVARGIPRCKPVGVPAECSLAADDAGCGVGSDFFATATRLGRLFCAYGPLDGGDGG